MGSRGPMGYLVERMGCTHGCLDCRVVDSTLRRKPNRSPCLCSEPELQGRLELPVVSVMSAYSYRGACVRRVDSMASLRGHLEVRKYIHAGDMSIRAGPRERQ